MYRIVALVLTGLAVELPHAATIAVPCSVPELKSAITTVNTNAQSNVLDLAAGCSYSLTTVDNVDATLGENGLPIVTTTADLTINGHGATIARANTIGTPSFRILQVGKSDGTTLLTTVTLNNLAIGNGRAIRTSDNPSSGAGVLFNGGGASSTFVANDVTWTGNAGDFGGALSATGIVTIHACSITGNFATDYAAGLYLARGPVAIDHSNISANTQDPAASPTTLLSGGVGVGCLLCSAISISDSVVSGNVGKGIGGGGIGLLGSSGTIVRTRVSGNTIDIPLTPAAGSEFGSGGGIAIGSFFGALTFEIRDSAIYGNSAATSGGGVGIAGTVTGTIANTTISSNTANVRGGGIGDAATAVSFVNATVAANAAPRGAGIDIGSYTDINNSTTVGAAAFANTIVGANIGSTDCYNDSGGIGGNASSLLQTDAAAPHACDGANGMHFMLRADPQLSALSAHGGPDLSHLPNPSSPAIDAGDDAAVPGGTTSDERGAGYRRIVAHVDLGAIETGNNDVIFRNAFEFH